METDPALRGAAKDHQPDDVWKERVKWLGDRVKDTAGKTYIAALGAALLAKATEPGVDSLTQRQEAGPPVPLADVPPRLAAWAAAR